MLDIDELNVLGRRIRGVLKAAATPMTCEEIAAQLNAPRADVFEALSISLHGWVEMRDGKFRLL